MLELDAQTLRALITMPDAIAAMHRGFVLLASGGIEQPQRLVTADAGQLVMVAKVLASDDTIVKAVSIRPENHARNLPTLHSALLWIDGETGAPGALLDGSTVTAFRTGATSGLATDLFADPAARVLVVYGAGAQAPDQIRGVCAVRDIELVEVVSRNRRHATALVEQMAQEFAHITFRASSDAHASSLAADIICCATTSSEPILRRSDVKAAVHINAIGSYTLNMRELAPDVISSARIVCVDQISASLAEAGEIVQALEGGLIAASALVEIGTLLRELPLSVMRGSQHRGAAPSVFKSVGLAAQDLAFASLAIERARAVGKTIARTGMHLAFPQDAPR